MADLLEREDELRMLEGLVDAVRNSGEGGAILVEGVAGIGKSSLLRALVASARGGGGVEVLSARATELESELAFGAVRRLLAPVVALPEQEREQVLAGPAALAAVVLGLRNAPGTDLADPLYALSWLVVNLAERSPVVVVLDDLHWSDAESGRFAAYLARQLDGLPVLLVASARPREPGAAKDFLDSLRDAATVITPAPLSEAASGRVIGDRANASDAHRLTGGNPFLLAELSRALERAEPGAALEQLRTEAVARSVSRRVGRISPEAVLLAHAVALFAAGADLPEAARVAGLPLDVAGAAADALISAQVLASVDARLEFLHPLMRSALYEELGTFARRRGHAAAAETLKVRGAPVEAIAAHLLAGEPAGEPENVRILRAAADASIAVVAPRAAVRYLRRALDEGAADPGERRALLVELGRWQRLTGDDAAQETLAAAFGASRGTRDEAPAAIELAGTAFVNGDHAVVERTVKAMRQAELSAADRLVLDMLLAESLWSQGSFDACVEMIDALPEDLPGQTAAQRMALAMAGAVRLMRGAPQEEVLDMLRRSVGEKGTAPGPIAGVDVGDPLAWMVQAGALEEAQALAEERMEHARASGDQALFASTQNAYGWMLALRGDHPGSIAAYRLALAQPELPPVMVAHVTVNLIGTLIEKGDLEEALAELEALDGARFAQIERLVEVRHAQIATLKGDHEAAVGPLLEYHQLGSLMPNPDLLFMAPDLADALVGAGRREEAIALARDLVTRSERTGGSFGRGVHRGTLGRLTGDIAELERAVDELARSPYRWQEARARLDLGSALRRAGRRVDAREQLRLALDYAERNGIVRFSVPAREELRLTGARPRSRALLSGAASLTPAEDRIARLAAEGMSNKQIAQHLFLTVGTVQTTLVRVYRKLDVSSRADLAKELWRP
jgi:DNA-binding CsgD family transcriptional regulator